MSAATVASARGWIGTPYHHGASLRGVGCDCLGLLRGVWREMRGAEPERAPPYSRDWAEAAGRETLLEAACRHLVPVEPPSSERDPRSGGLPVGPGEVLLFRWREGLPAKHCAIASGEGTMIHAHEGAAVAEVALALWWMRHLAARFRFPETDR